MRKQQKMKYDVLEGVILEMKIEGYVAQLIRASLDNDLQMVRAISTKVIRNIKNENPRIASEISEALNYNASGLRSIKSLGYESTPQDIESKLELLKVNEPIDVEPPIYSKEIEEKIEARRNVNTIEKREQELNKEDVLILV